MLGIDMDGCVTNFTHGFSRLAHKLYGAPIVSHNDVPAWRWQDWYMDSGPQAAAIIEGTWEVIKNEEDTNFWLSLPPLFPREMAALVTVANEVPCVFITRRDGPKAWEQTIAWLQQYGITEPHVYRVKSGEEKSQICKRFGVSVMIEDCPQYAEELLQHGVPVEMVLWKYNEPWYEDNKSQYRRGMLGGTPSLARALYHGVERMKYGSAKILRTGNLQ